MEDSAAGLHLLLTERHLQEAEAEADVHLLLMEHHHLLLTEPHLEAAAAAAVVEALAADSVAVHHLRVMELRLLAEAVLEVAVLVAVLRHRRMVRHLLVVEDSAAVLHLPVTELLKGLRLLTERHLAVEVDSEVVVADSAEVVVADSVAEVEDSEAEDRRHHTVPHQAEVDVRLRPTAPLQDLLLVTELRQGLHLRVMVLHKDRLLATARHLLVEVEVEVEDLPLLMAHPALVDLEGNLQNYYQNVSLKSLISRHKLE